MVRDDLTEVVHRYWPHADSDDELDLMMKQEMLYELQQIVNKERNLVRELCRKENRTTNHKGARL